MTCTEIDTDETTELTGPERERLGELEATIKKNVQAFLDTGEALSEIRDSKLYRQSHATFESYCYDRWGLKPSRAYQLMDAAGVVEGLKSSTMVETLPQNERQARELTRLPEPERAPAWEKAVAGAPVVNGKPKVTTGHVRRVVAESTAPHQPDPNAPPWAEFNAGIDDVIDKLMDAYRKLAQVTEYDAPTKQLRSRWSQGYSAAGTLGTILALRKALENGQPAEPSSEPPGYFTRYRAELQRAVQENRRQPASAQPRVECRD